LPDKILIVDDEPDTVNLAKRILERKGYQVITASNGEEALQKSDSDMPDFIFLDVVMPGKSGLEVCRILKTQAKTRLIPVVMFTALGRDVDRKLSKESGADGHLTKPFASESLVGEIKGQLDGIRGSRFSTLLGLGHDTLKGKKILLEFDPSTPYERLVRDFALECVSHKEKIVILTKKGSSVQRALDGDEGIELVDLTPQTILSPIIQQHPSVALGLVYDSLTDLALSVDVQAAYKFARSALELLSEPRMSALFLLNPTAHEAKDVSSLRGLFASHMTYGKQGVENVRTA